MCVCVMGADGEADGRAAYRGPGIRGRQGKAQGLALRGEVIEKNLILLLRLRCFVDSATDSHCVST